MKHYDRKGLVTVQERFKLCRIRDLINGIIDEKIEIESFSPLRARFSSNSSKVPELAEESNESDSDDSDGMAKMKKDITDIYHELKVLP